jgi:hypothetical protein
MLFLYLRRARLFRLDWYQTANRAFVILSGKRKLKITLSLHERRISLGVFCRHAGLTTQVKSPPSNRVPNEVEAPHRLCDSRAEIHTGAPALDKSLYGTRKLRTFKFPLLVSSSSSVILYTNAV